MLSSTMEQQHHTCKLCSKSFSSFPALFGHMRRHSAASASPPISSVSEPLNKRRRSSPSDADSAVSDAAMTAEEAAYSLVLLSLDVEIEPIPVKRRRSMAALSQAARCPDCKREFISYQALGGHRKGLKNGNVSCVKVVSHAGDANVILQHKCRICRREFGSTQALGGHKRAHMCSLSTVTVASSPSPLLPPLRPPPRAAVKFSFDLNSPPPVEDEVAELSAVLDEGICSSL